MPKPFRYLLYLCLGFALYYMMGADQHPENLQQFHKYAPVIILALVALLFIARRFTKGKNEQDTK